MRLDLSKVWEDRERSLPGTVFFAAETGDLDCLRAFADGSCHGKDVAKAAQALQQQDLLEGRTPLHLAADAGQTAAVKFLISRGVPLDPKDLHSATPMHLAAAEGRCGVVEALLQAAGGDVAKIVNAKDVEGDLPLHWAAIRGHAEVVELLVHGGCLVNAANRVSETPLHCAAYNGHKDVVAVLVRLGADMEEQDCFGNTALHVACHMNKLGVMQLLLSLGARMQTQNTKGASPHDLCVSDAGREVLVDYGYRDFQPEPSRKKDVAAGTLHNSRRQNSRGARPGWDSDDFPEPIEEGEEETSSVQTQQQLQLQQEEASAAFCEEVKEAYEEARRLQRRLTESFLLREGSVFQVQEGSAVQEGSGLQGGGNFSPSRERLSATDSSSSQSSKTFSAPLRNLRQTLSSRN